MFVQARKLKPGHRLKKNGRTICRILDPNVDGWIEVEYTDGRTGYLRGPYEVSRPDVVGDYAAREGCDRWYADNRQGES